MYLHEYVIVSACWLIEDVAGEDCGCTSHIGACTGLAVVDAVSCTIVSSTIVSSTIVSSFIVSSSIVIIIYCRSQECYRTPRTSWIL